MLPSRPWHAMAIVALVLALALLAAGTLARMRAATLLTQGRQLSALAQEVTDDTDRGLQDTDTSLAQMRAALQEGRLSTEGADTSPALLRLAAHMPLVDSLWLVDDAWNPIAASDGTPLPPVAALSSGPETPGRNGFVIGQPAPATAVGATRVIVARRFGAPPGHASGWILAAVPESALLARFVASHPPHDARLAIFRGDGVRLAGRLEDEQKAAEPFSALRLTALHEDQVHHFRDGTERLVGMHDARHYDVTIVLTRDLDTVLAGWRTTTRLAACAIALLLALAGAGLWLAGRPPRGAGPRA